MAAWTLTCTITLLMAGEPAKAPARRATQTCHQFLAQAERRIMSLPLWQPATPAWGACEVRAVPDVAYRTGADADPIRHRLDLYVPHGKKQFPVIVLVHGGGWIMGDNRCCGLYTSVAQFLAGQGIGVVLPNYRLSPAVAHPEHARDVARAVRWTYDHIADYGGNPKCLYLMGHSAGGHLVTLLGTDATYLTAERLNLGNLKGVIAFSGVYRIPPGTMHVALGGTGSTCFRPDEMVPMRAATGLLPKLPDLGIRLDLDIFAPAFGTDASTRRAASPLTHVRRGLPPFLLLTGDRDLPTLAGMATDFHKALRRAGNDATLLQLKDRNHNSLIFSLLHPEDPAARAMLDFVRRTQVAGSGQRAGS